MNGSRTGGLAVKVIAVLAIGSVVVLTLGPDVVAGLGSGALDRTAHAGAYAGLTAAALLALPWVAAGRSGIGAALLLVLAVCAFGGLMEIFQGLEHRDADILDAAANAAGAVTVFTLWLTGRAMGSIMGRRGRGAKSNVQGGADRPGVSDVRDEPVLAR